MISELEKIRALSRTYWTMGSMTYHISGKMSVRKQAMIRVV